MKKAFLAVLAILMCFSVVIEAQTKLSRKDFRSPESLLRQVIDDSTNALRVEVVPMPEGVPFKAADTKKNQSIAHILNNLIDGDANRLKIEFTNFQLFPYDKLVTNWAGTSKAFRYYVDGDNGNDANDGLKMSTAKKTINGALALLPSNLQNYEFHVFVHPGTYNENILLSNNRATDGQILISWVGTFWNTSSDAYVVWARNGDTVIARNDNQVIINGSHSLGCKNLTVTYRSFKPGIASWNKGACATRFKFNFPSSGTNDGYSIYAGTLWFQNSPEINLGGTGRGFYVTGDASLKLQGAYFKGGSGGASTSTSDWSGAIVINSNSILNVGEEDYVYADEFPMPNGNSLYFEDVKQGLWYNSNAGSDGSKHKFICNKNYGVGWVNQTGTTTRFNINTSFAGYLRYNSTITELVDPSAYSHITYDVATSTTTNYMSPKILNDENAIAFNTSLKVKEVTTEPTITQDNQAGFYVKGDKVVLKFNSGGTLKYRYMDLSDTTATWTYSTVAP